MRLRPGRRGSCRSEPWMTVCVVHGPAELDLTNKLLLKRAGALGREGVTDLGRGAVA